ncbi:MAG: hypothetical protein WB562_12215, partial [Candidatus Sulfotelmatobacter sp.]
AQGELSPANPSAGKARVGTGDSPVHPSPDLNLATQELEGVVRNGIVELVNGKLAEGTRVQVRVKRGV